LLNESATSIESGPKTFVLIARDLLRFSSARS
jgi:hypothetical protein